MSYPDLSSYREGGPYSQEQVDVLLEYIHILQSENMWLRQPTRVVNNEKEAAWWEKNE